MATIMRKTKNSPWPEIDVRVCPDGRAEARRFGVVHAIEVNDDQDVNTAVKHWLAQQSKDAHRQLTVRIVDPTGVWPLACAPDGSLTHDSGHGDDPEPELVLFSEATTVDEVPNTPPAVVTPVPDLETDPSQPSPSPADLLDEDTEAPRDEAAEPPRADVTPVETAEDETLTDGDFSFLGSTPQKELAHSGWRGTLNLIGLKLSPSAGERRLRERDSALRSATAPARTVAVVNGKGGAGKTPTSVLLSQIFAQYGAASVLAWDVNPTRGTLGWRTSAGNYDATIADLTAHIEELRAADDLAAIERFVHRQSANFAVLRSQPDMLANQQVLGSRSLRAVYRLLRKYFATIIMDSGNDESSTLWQTMISLVDQIVVPTSTREDCAESARLLLDNLSRHETTAHLVDSAVIVVSQAAPTDPALTPVLDLFEKAYPEQVCAIPYDKALGNRHLDLADLAPRTHEAWLNAALKVGHAHH